MFKDVTFRPLNRSDFPLLQRWLALPHVDAWWHKPLDLAGLEDKYGPRVDGAEPVYVFMIEYDERPIGFIQWYRWSDYPAYAKQIGAGTGVAGIDLAIGELDMIGLGIGPIVLRRFVKEIIFSTPGMKSIITDVAVDNSRSLRAFEKAGFSPTNIIQREGENFERRLLRL
jgi:aminoglycoside 6'-N-acetyltransferase